MSSANLYNLFEKIKFSYTSMVNSPCVTTSAIHNENVQGSG